MRWPALGVVLLALAACDRERDAADAELEARLDAKLGELQALAADAPASRRELERITAELARFQPATRAELLASAGPKAMVETSPQDSYTLATVVAPGTMHDALEFLAGVTGKSTANCIAGLTLGDGRWIVKLMVVHKPALGSAAPLLATSAPAPSGSFCWASCRERRARIAEKQARLQALGGELGDAVALPEARTALAVTQQVRSKLAGAEWLPVLRRLEQTSWFGAGWEVWLMPDEGGLLAPGEREQVRRRVEGGPLEEQKPARVAACEAALAPLAHCRPDRQGVAFRLAPPAQ